MRDLVSIRFTRSSPPYTGSDIAGFTPEKAAAFVDGGFAVYAKDVPSVADLKAMKKAGLVEASSALGVDPNGLKVDVLRAALIEAAGGDEEE